MEREGFTNAEKKRMQLSRETLLGLRITGNLYIVLCIFASCKWILISNCGLYCVSKWNTLYYCSFTP